MTTSTQSEFATLIGKDKSYVTRLKQAGRLVLVQTSDGERVDVEASQALLAKTADPAHGGQDAERGRGAGKAANGSYNDARTRNELAKAQMAELDLAVQQGKLVDAEEARLFAADLATSFRSALEILPDRLAPELVPLKETEEVRAVLVENFGVVLGDLADKILKWGKV
jgi:phage terminase Nu1 subunit (DNA packaging protein)